MSGRLSRTLRRLAILAALSCAGAAQAAANPACPNGGMTIAYYEFSVAYHRGAGYDVDLVHALAQRLGCAIRDEQGYPRIRALKLLESGQADIGTSTLITPERQRLLWLLPYNRSKKLVLVNHDARADTLDALLKTPGLRWGVIRGYRHSPEEDALLSALERERKLVIASNEDDLYKMVCNGVVTAVFGHPISFDPWLQRHRAQQRVTVHDFFPDSEIISGGIALSKARFDARAAALWQEALRQMYRDGALRALMLRYLTEPSVDQVLKPPLE